MPAVSAEESMAFASGDRVESLRRLGGSDERSVGGSQTFADTCDPSLEARDPSLAEGHKVVYDRECPFELRVQDEDTPPEAGTLEPIRCEESLGLGGPCSLGSLEWFEWTYLCTVA